MRKGSKMIETKEELIERIRKWLAPGNETAAEAIILHIERHVLASRFGWRPEN